MKVTFVDYGEEIASSRLRARIPQQELAKLGIKQGKDVLIYGKSWLADDKLKEYLFKVYDVCDDHYDRPELKDYYRKHTAEADLVTCNSEVMKARIKAVSGRDAIVIKEPYESDEQPPSIGPSLLWFGHASNLPDLSRLIPQLKHPLLILSNHPDCTEWTPESFRHQARSQCLVVIPTGKSLAKSENRMVEAVRNGKYVCAEHLPSYEPFAEFFPLGDIPAQIDWALSNPTEALTKISLAQSYIKQHYSPEKIGRDWLRVIYDNFYQC
jgi:hypothetical protein